MINLDLLFEFILACLIMGCGIGADVVWEVQLLKVLLILSGMIGVALRCYQLFIYKFWSGCKDEFLA